MKIINFIFLAIFINCSNAVSVEEDLTLTIPERHALDQFREMIGDYLPHKYMHTDIYLIKFLRAKDLNLKAATNMLLSNLKWRTENGMDNILDEDFSDFEQEFPVSFGYDFTGRPVAMLDASQWDIRKAIVNGKRDKLIRFGFRISEMVVKQVRDAQNNGQNVTQTVTLVNLKGFNLIQHGCIKCIAVYVNFLMTGENNYPGMAHRIVGINTPASFDSILRILRPLMSKETKAALVFFGTNQHEWQRYLLNMIPSDQLLRQFGGTRYE